MKNHIKLYARPKLKNPVMLASWPGIGDVSIIVASYLKKKLDFKDLGEVEPSYFFDAIGVVARDNIVEEPHFPQSRFYYLKNPAGNDLILFIGEDQPVTKSYELANCVLDVAERFQVKRIYTCAAALSRIHHTEQPRVWGVVTSPHMSQELDKYGLVQKGNLQIAGLNGLLLGVTKERNIEGICLLGEVPMHATRIQNPVAALAVLQVLTKMLNIEVDIGELTQIANEAAERLKQVAAEAMGEYIDQFTQPIWEYGQEEDEEED
jgi:proteasome assembly chaperone (PAC2) family protein